MYSRVRQLLYCQDEIAQLQKDLIKQDDDDASTALREKLLRSRSKYEYCNEKIPQKAIINQMGSKLKEHSKQCWLLSGDIISHSVRRPGGKDN